MNFFSLKNIQIISRGFTEKIFGEFFRGAGNKGLNLYKSVASSLINLYLFEVYDANDENVVIGKMVVTVEILESLLAIKNQLEHVNASVTFE